MFKQSIQRKEKRTEKKIGPSMLGGVIKVAVWGFLLLVVGSSLYFILNMSSLLSTNQALIQKIDSLEASVDLLQNESQQSDNLDVFNRYFVQRYYRTEEEPADYSRQLADYLSKQLTPPNNAQVTDHKKVTSIQSWRKRPLEDGIYEVSYLVTYQFKETPGSELLIFDVAEKNGKYAVVSYPYAKKVAEFKTTAIDKARLTQKEDLVEVEKGEAAAVKNWLDQTFFPRYVEATNTDDLSYMMKKPIMLGNIQTYKGLKEMEVVQDKEKQLIVSLVIETEDRLTKLKTQQELTLTLTKKEANKFYVNELNTMR